MSNILWNRLSCTFRNVYLKHLKSISNVLDDPMFTRVQITCNAYIYIPKNWRFTYCLPCWIYLGKIETCVTQYLRQCKTRRHQNIVYHKWNNVSKQSGPSKVSSGDLMSFRPVVSLCRVRTNAACSCKGTKHGIEDFIPPGIFRCSTMHEWLNLQVLGWGLLSQFSPFRYFPNFFEW